MSKIHLALLIVFSMFITFSSWAGQAAPLSGNYLVNSNFDEPDLNPGDGLCQTQFATCTLRAAIQEANADGQTSTITFSSPMVIGQYTYPKLTAPNTTIDASNHWDGTWPSGRPGVRIAGPGLVINTDLTRIYGIEFIGSNEIGISIEQGTMNEIGGSGEGQRNVFLVGTGINISHGGSGNRVAYNYFGTWDGQTAVPSKGGVLLWGNSNTIELNLFGANSPAINFLAGDKNVILDNIIGANKLKNKALGTGIGLRIERSHQNVIGPGNFIAGNASHGIWMLLSDENSITGNTVGDIFTVGNGGDGFHLEQSNNNMIGHMLGNSIGGNGGHGLYLQDSSGNQILHNSVAGNGQDGLHIASGVDNLIGGDQPWQGNTFNGNQESGVHLKGDQTANNTLSGNTLGLKDGAFDAGNGQDGVLLDDGARSNKIGGLNSGQGNHIGFNGWSGIYISGANTRDNVVEGNVIGAPINWGWPAGNGRHGIAIYDGAHSNWIGWFNTIIASSWSGVAIVNSHDNVVWLNRIGSDGAANHWGSQAYGVHLVNSPNNQILANEIAFSGQGSGQDGVRVQGASSTGNAIKTNSIHDSSGAGIALVQGGNHNLGAPLISQASCQGPVSGTACPNCTVQIFSDVDDEGQFFEGEVIADAVSGSFNWSGAPNGPQVTATATDGSGNTSPFSAALAVSACNTVPTAAFDIQPPSGSTQTLFQFDASASSDAEDSPANLEIRWDWEDDGTWDSLWQTSKMASHTYPTAGLYNVRLEVRDSGGLTDAATKQIQVIQSSGAHHLFLSTIMR